MLSDEEKKAIDVIKSLGISIYNGKSQIIPGDTTKEISTAIYTTINLIEKQSKEIEELKTEKAKRSWVRIKENGEVEPLFYVSEDKIKRDYISKKKLYKHIEMLEKENCHDNCGVEKLIDCGRQCSIGCTIKNIKKILEE